jgi:hypothetical protein
MTAQSSDSASSTPGQRRLLPAERDFPPPDTPLDVFLHAQAQVWGGRGASGEAGFAALRFDATAGSVTRTRSFLRSTLTSWQLSELVDDATTVAAELVANAVTHALCSPASPLPPQPSAWIALVRTEDSVVCAVADPSPDLPIMSAPEPFAESGRGLHIVAELSETWGHSGPEPAGKAVWARLASGR